MCVQYRGGAQYRGGCSVPWGISWVLWGDILSTVGVFSTVGDIMINVGGYLEYRGGVFSTVGDIMSTVGGYLEYRGGCSVPWGISWCTWGISWVPWGVFSTVGEPSFEIWVPWGISWCMWGDIMSTVGVFSTVGYSNDKRLFPPRYWTPSTVLMISPTCIMISPHGTEHPPRYSR